MSRNSNRNNSQGYVHSNPSRETSQYRDYSRYSRASATNNYSRTTSSRANDVNLGQNNYGNRNDNLSGLDVEASQYSRTGTNHYSHRKNMQKRRNARRKNFFVCVIILIVLGIVGVGVYKFFPIKVNFNNKECQLTYGKSLSDAVENSGTKVNPGNYIAVDDSVIKAGEGNEFYCEVNGTAVTDKQFRLHDGDTVSYQNGKDIMEDYTSVDSDIKPTSEITGTGSIHKFNGDGSNGVWSKMTGKVSKKYAERQTKAPGNVVCQYQNANPGSDKVLALTFDDGPSDEYTQKILDVLKKYNAHATFCVIGENCEDSWGKKLLQAEDAAGHQICTHSYDHARPVGGSDMTIMSAEKQIQEITKGQNLIAQAIGHDASTVVRLPGGNINANTVRLIAPYVTAELGWNVDTGDWKQPGVSKIVNAMKEANSGDIILCHDGGGDRSQTVEALEQVLPYFTEKGYKFITVDELMQYPAAAQKSK